MKVLAEFHHRDLVPNCPHEWHNMRIVEDEEGRRHVEIQTYPTDDTSWDRTFWPDVSEFLARFPQISAKLCGTTIIEVTHE